MWMLSVVPFLLQGILIGIDEFYFHHKRGLPKWERVGHPLDTFSVLACLIFVLFTPFNEFTFKIYVALALFSCLMVTKDEFIHKDHCPWLENWLHACLFILHPLCLITAGLIWASTQGFQVFSWTSDWTAHSLLLTYVLQLQFILMFLFFCYQIIYWNFIWQSKNLK